MKSYRSADDVRAYLAAKLRRPPRDDIWNELVERDFIREVLGAGGEFDLGEALNGLYCYYQEQDSRYSGGRERKARATSQRAEWHDKRLEYLSQVVALEASEDPLVVGFRSECLGGQLLGLDQVAEWVSARGSADSEDGEATWFVEGVPLTWSELRAVECRIEPGVLPAESTAQASFDPQLGFDPHKRAVELLSAVIERKAAAMGGALVGAVARALAGPSPWRGSSTSLARARFLACRLPEDTVLHPIAWGGTLHRLYDLGRYLASEYGWPEDDATVFALTGYAPTDYIYDAQLRRNHRFPALDAVELHFPYRLSPRDVAAFYAEGRSWLDREPVSESATKRDYPLSEKHLELALFSLTHEGGNADREAWNSEHGAQHPEWRYTKNQVTNFTRDMRAAYSRLTGKKLPKRERKGRANEQAQRPWQRDNRTSA